MIFFKPPWKSLAPSFRFEEPSDKGGAVPAISAETQAKLDRLAAYEAYDLNPEQLGAIKEDWVRLAQDEQTRKAAPAPKPAVKEEVETDPKAAQLKKQVRDEVMKAIPELSKLSTLEEVNEKLDRVLNGNQQRDVDGAHDALVGAASKLVQKLNVDLSTADGKAVALDLGELIEKTVFSDRALFERYLKGDKTVAKDAYEKVQASSIVKRLNVPTKVLPKKKFTSFTDTDGNPDVATLETIRKDLPPRGRFRELANRSHSLIFSE